MATETATHSDLAIPPGEYLEEVIGELGMTKDELATRMARPASKLSPIFKGDKAITPDTALRLEKVVGVPAHIWLGLESEYRLTLARQQETGEQVDRQRETGLIPAYCYNALVQVRAVAKKTDPLEKVLELQRFFGVTSLSLVPEIRRYEAAFRYGSAGKKEQSPHAMAAWLRLGELKAHRQECAPFSKANLERSLATLRAMTLQTPEVFLPQLRKTLAEAGVALVLCPHFAGTRAHGATYWLGREKAVLMLTIRGKWADIFWFSLFHELGHILMHERQAVFIEDGCDGPDQIKKEAAANRFAADHLIPPRDYALFVRGRDFRPADLRGFAGSLGVGVGIVVGRLQHDGHLARSVGNDLRTRYEWAEKAAV